jgi:hypothetical protein
MTGRCIFVLFLYIRIPGTSKHCNGLPKPWSNNSNRDNIFLESISPRLASSASLIQTNLVSNHGTYTPRKVSFDVHGWLELVNQKKGTCGWVVWKILSIIFHEWLVRADTAPTWLQALHYVLSLALSQFLLLDDE